MKKPRFKDYRILVYWDERPKPGRYVAEITAIPTCDGEGPTYAAALIHLEETFEIMRAEYKRAGLKLPEPIQT